MACRAIKNVKEDLLRCPICLDPVKNPRMLPCQHTMCVQCLVVHISEERKKSGSFDSFTCPDVKCKAKTSFNYRLDSNEVAETFPVSPFLEAIIQTVNQYESPEMSCEIHDKRPMEFYCFTDKLLACSYCFYDKHRDQKCKVVTLREHFEENKQELQKVRKELAEIEETVPSLDTKRIYELSIEQARRDLDNLQLNLGLFYQNAIDEIDEMKNKILQNVSYTEGIPQDGDIMELKSEVEKTKTELENIDNGVKFIMRFENLKRQKDDLVSKFKPLKEKYETYFKVSFAPKSYLKDLNVNSKPLLGTIRYHDEEVKLPKFGVYKRQTRTLLGSDK